MKYNFDILASAYRELYNIGENLLNSSEFAALKFKESFDKFLDNVSDMPAMYPKYSDNPKYRKAPLAYDYLAFYQINEKNKTVVIHRILHSKSNIRDFTAN